jgi:lipopolysaccharide transport system ATP-binding protein
MSTVIKVENLSKRYRLGVINRDMLYKDLQSRWAKFRGKEDPNAPIGFKHDKRLEHGDEFWALRNVDLEVKEGEIIGIIGRNGAGKSTLLKILSQITAPTEGRIKVRGRIASLLEVGTGFHPELTGRENVYLNGAILGMTRKEVRSKFDEIVAFADLADFIDTPVKRYSSGMYVRLAFAVAAHLDPEILIVDEVLAVGDMQFQRKCLGKMQDVKNSGKTVLFVSHNMTTINSLCQTCALLGEGKIEAIGQTEAITKRYFSSISSDDTGAFIQFGDNGPGDDTAKLRSIRLIDEESKSISFADIAQTIGIEMLFDVRRNEVKIVPNFHVYTQNQCVFVSNAPYARATEAGTYRSVMWIPPRLLNDGLYFVNVAVTTMIPLKAHFYLENRFSFTVVENIHDEMRNDFANTIPGVVRPLLDWSLEKIPSAQRAKYKT